MSDLGKIAYEAYGSNVNWVTFSGQKMPSWEDQNERLKAAWNVAAQAVLEGAHEGGASR